MSDRGRTRFVCRRPGADLADHAGLHGVELDATPGEQRGPILMLGEYDNRVFRALLGFSGGEIERLRAEGVIA